MKFQDKGTLDFEFKASFVQEIGTTAPEVLQDLKDLLPQFNKVFADYDYRQIDSTFINCIKKENTKADMILFYLPPKWILKQELSEQEKEEKLNDFFLFRNLFNKWIRKYSLDKDWLKEVVFRTLYSWNKYKRYSRDSLISPVLGYDIPGGEAINFHTGGWSYTRADSELFKRDLVKQFEVFIDAYIEETAKRAKENGFKQIRRPPDFDRLKWLVCWTVKNWKMKEIVLSFNISDERIVWDAFKSFKKYDLPVRKKRETEDISSPI